MQKNEIGSRILERTHRELVLRIISRDRIKIVCITITSAFFGFAIGYEKITNYSFLLMVPFFCFGCSILILHHNLVIIGLLKYRATEVFPRIKKKFEETNGIYIPEFDESDIFRDYGVKAIKYRSWAHLIIMITPCSLALVINYEYSFGCFPMVLFWWFSSDDVPD